MKRPIRKKGYWRAVARKEPWALEIHKLYHKDKIQWLIGFSFRTIDLREVVSDASALLDLMKEDEDSWKGR